jgi:subtilisin family serine protease
LLRPGDFFLVSVIVAILAQIPSTKISVVRILFCLSFLFHVYQTSFAQPAAHKLTGTIWSGTHSPLIKGTELYFQGDTLILIDLDGYKPPDQYVFIEQNDTLRLQMIDEFSIACRQESEGIYRIHRANNGEKLLLKPIQDACMERFTRLVAESPWYRKREPAEIRNDWFFLDPEKDKVAGTSVYDAYKFLKFRKSSTITVALIGSAIDYSHEDLKDVIWKNKKEIPDNKTDDDKNGFKDDVSGWFFSSTKSGIPLEFDQNDATQIVAIWKDRFANADPSKLTGQDLKDFQLFSKATERFEEGKTRAENFRKVFSDSLTFFEMLNKMVMQSEEPVSVDQIESWKIGEGAIALAVKSVVKEIYDPKAYSFDQFNRRVRADFTKLKTKFSPLWLYEFNNDWLPRNMVGDHPELPYEKMYGCGFIAQPANPSLETGTRCASIIAGKRSNGKGVEGIAENVTLMLLGAEPTNGSARDKDIANSIRYAADMGAKILQIGIVNEFSPFRKTVDEAIQYAEKKGVLIVSSAGNMHRNLDSSLVYPNRILESGQLSKNWVVVGNSTVQLDDNLVSVSTGFGKKGVDILAPGTMIFSATPGNKYTMGTDCLNSASVVTGIAALVWSCFPSLTAADIKKAILESAYQPSGLQVRKPGSVKKTTLDQLCATGGIINAKKMVFAAEKLAKKRKS